jgi:phosphate transport system permease protein
LAQPIAAKLPAVEMERHAILAEAWSLAHNPGASAFNPLATELVGPLREAEMHYLLIGAALTVVLTFVGGAYGYTRVRGNFPARTQMERAVMLALLLASLMAILTTVGIVLSLLYETGLFFNQISPIDFLTGLHWAPKDVAVGEDFGAVPLFWGTIYIGAIIAMIVAIPLGLMSAIYLTQYATPTARKVLKPVLEILAGIPTVVYGYFAALTVAPIVRDFAGALGKANPSTESALAAGLVMGVMIIPFVSSMADDSIAAVPQAMRDGSLAMGATESETIKKVLLPAALPGIVAGVMLAVSRAIGETMIVVMAAGAAARLSANPFDTMTTVTYQIVQLLTGDQEFNSPKTLSAFALGLVLFVVTLILNIVALRVVKRFREAYE